MGRTYMKDRDSLQKQWSGFRRRFFPTKKPPSHINIIDGIQSFFLLLFLYNSQERFRESLSPSN